MALAVHRTSQTIWLGEAYELPGRSAEALESLRSGLDLARAHEQRGSEAEALWRLGESHASQSPPAVEWAEEACREALSLATELGMRPLVAHCHLRLGRLRARAGERGQAQDPLAMAATMYREVDMRSWLAEAEAELGEPS